MPATKKKKRTSARKKTVTAAAPRMEKTSKASELNQTLLMVFAFAMMAFAYVLYTVYAK